MTSDLFQAAICVARKEIADGGNNCFHRRVSDWVYVLVNGKYADLLKGHTEEDVEFVVGEVAAALESIYFRAPEIYLSGMRN